MIFGASFGGLSPSLGQRLRRATQHVVLLVCGAAQEAIGLGDQPLDAFVDVLAICQDALGSESNVSIRTDSARRIGIRRAKCACGLQW